MLCNAIPVDAVYESNLASVTFLRDAVYNVGGKYLSHTRLSNMDSPEFLGPYRIGEILGRGGMGTVFAAVHATTNERVAVKLIASHVADEMRFRRRFDAEIETLKRLRHPGIVRLIGYGEEEGQLFYSMELVQGETLQRRIRREKRLDWSAAIDVAIQMCAALKHAHDIGVIHRDLKPANLILTDDGTVKLVDFGIAKIFGAGEQTAIGSVMGTADYMAPEQATGSSATSRTDLYSVGTVMYAMLTGRPPFRGKNVTEVIDLLKLTPPVPLDMIDPDLPEDVVALVHHLLEKSPENRPPTALAVMNRLRAMQAGLQRNDETGLDTLPTEVSDKDSSLTSSGTSLGAGNTSLSTGAGAKSRPRDSVDHESSQDTHRVGGDPIDPTHRRRPASPDDVTIVSQEAHATVDSDAPDDVWKPANTHFQTVDQSQAAGLFEAEESHQGGTVTHGLSIGILIAVLLIVGTLVIQAMRKPSPDDLYQKIADAAQVGELSTARADIEQFLKLYPDHPRTGNVHTFDLSLKLTGAVRRLQLKKNLGLKPLAAPEQAFLEAIQTSERDPERGRDKLTQWLDVFAGIGTDDNDEPAELSRLVRFQLDLLNRRPAPLGEPSLGDPRVRELISRIEAGRDKPVQQREDLLRGILRLYKGKPWAKPAVEMATEELMSLAKEKNLERNNQHTVQFPSPEK